MGLWVVGAVAIAIAAKAGFDFFQAMGKKGNGDEQES